MSAGTFYLAAASTNVEQAKARISDLESMGWTCAYDWTGLNEPRERWPVVAVLEVGAALTADLFVALAPISRGAALEIGVRLARGDKPAHLVGEWDQHLFACHPLVKHHATWEFFLASLSKGDA